MKHLQFLSREKNGADLRECVHEEDRTDNPVLYSKRKTGKELITCTRHVFAWMGSEYSGLRWDETLSHLQALSISLVV